MKIGKVAEKYNLTIATIRYYINNGLLVPEQKGTQYDFDRSCLEDLEMILHLKSLYFTLHDIHAILTLKRISNFNDPRHIDELLQYFIAQQERLNGIHQETQGILENINAQISTLQERKAEFTVDKYICSGISLSFLPFLCCPKCGENLKLHDATLENQQIMKGVFQCDCGYQLKIENGILIAPLEAYAEGDKPDLECMYYNLLPPDMMTLFKKSYNWLSSEIAALPRQDGSRVVMETHINSYFYLLTNFPSLDANDLYIIVDNHPSVLQMYKTMIDKMNIHANILYLACNTLEYPLKRQCIDVYIDFYASNEYATFQEGWLHQLSWKYLKPRHHYLGTYFYFRPSARSRQLLLEKYPTGDKNNFNKKSFIYQLKEQEMKLCNDIEIGTVRNSGNSMTFHIPGDELSLYSYHYMAR
ncbi:MAG: MerR family transcriptional regulator [Firmicutes bacterium]|nr:MerR family transcriptional regulator [Bacillota bacterium]